MHSADHVRRARKAGSPPPFRRRWIAGLFVIAVVGLAACGDSGSSSTASSGSSGANANTGAACTTPTGSYTLDVVADVTGTLATSLGLGASGVKAYAEKVNSEGGVNCKTIKVNVLDGQSNADTGAAQFRQATSDEPVAIVHFGLSTTLTAAQSVLASANIPVLTASGTDALLYPEPQPYLYMIAPSATQNSDALIRGTGQLLGGDIKGKRVAVVNVNTAYSQTVADTINSRAATDGFEVVDTQKIEFQTPSFTAQAAEIANKKPDAVILVVSAVDTATIVNALVTAGVAVPMLEYTAGNTPEVFQKLANKNFHAIRESVVADSSQLLKDAAAKAGVSDAAKTTFFTDGWIATEVLVAGLEACGASCEGAALIKSLDGLGSLTIDGDLNFGPLTFSADRHAGLSAVQIFGWDGTKDVATGEPTKISG